MNALLRPLVKLTALSALAFAPNALAYDPFCDDVCSDRTPCTASCYYWATRTYITCGEAGFECWSGVLKSAPVSMNEQQPSAADTEQTCHESRQAPESSSQPARS
ncbi:hypothetical protein [Corallococcus llansteffanensis]|uniref:Uncharacterized protein n=1 Tax=Corallococcus llansteffanensis TaxID=2316731 RepID=A0A3A8Q9Z7_9BACT|nr:hypothetical protein [Corallococcus llansteffanensis]RKH63850.1 hypothetical protein D7V93_08250 [Corallococcus llansteffanensis]